MNGLKLTTERKKKIMRIVTWFVYIDGYCKECGQELNNGCYGEKKFFGWIKWCHKCYGNKFINEISSSPQSLSKYYEIYGKHPKDVIPH